MLAVGVGTPHPVKVALVEEGLEALGALLQLLGVNLIQLGFKVALLLRCEHSDLLASPIIPFIVAFRPVLLLKGAPDAALVGRNRSLYVVHYPLLPNVVAAGPLIGVGLAVDLIFHVVDLQFADFAEADFGLSEGQ